MKRIIKNILPIIYLSFTALIFSCNADEEESANRDEDMPGETSNQLQFNGESYSFIDGVVSDFGSFNPLGVGDPVHYNYDFIIIDDELMLVTENGETFYDADNFSILLDVELFSPGTQNFQTGTFEFLNTEELAIEDIEGEFFFEFLDLLVETPSGGLLYTATSGTVEVIENSNLNYTLNYNVQVQQYNEDQEVLVPGTAENISFSYTGDFKFRDETSNAGRSLNSQKRLYR